MPNKLGFTRSGSGLSIADIQQAVNNIYTASGVSEIATGTVYNAPAGTITNGQNYQGALTTLANKFAAVTGHHHTGASGDGPILTTASISNSPGAAYSVSGTNTAGTSLSAAFAWSDHQHQGVHSLAATGQSQLYSDVILAASGAAVLSQSGQVLTIFAPASGTAVNTLAASGSAALTGSVVLAASGSASVTQSGQVITVFAPASGSAVSSIAASGNAALTGAVVLQAGAGIGLTQTGQNISIAATGSSGSLPSGMIMPYAGTSAPAGWLPCDGSAVSRTVYAALFAAIATTYGAGDGTTTFNVPNAQGVFLRGAGSQTISSKTFSGTQGTSTKDSTAKNGLSLSDPGHLHDMQWSGTNGATGGIGILTWSAGVHNVNGTTEGAWGYTYVGANTTGITMGAGDSETAPANIVVLYCIKT